MVTTREVAELVAEHHRQLLLGLDLVDQATGEADATPREGDRVDAR